MFLYLKIYQSELKNEQARKVMHNVTVFLQKKEPQPINLEHLQHLLL